MHIMMIASECSPIAKVGGLADVVISLSKALKEKGHQVDIILPKYDSMRYDKIENLEMIYEQLWAPYQDNLFANQVYRGTVEGVNCYFISANWYKRFFDRGQIYSESDDSERFAYFSRAALEFIYQTHRNVDIIHCHDWQTGLIPVLYYEVYQRAGMTHPKVFYSVHNFEHQGIAHYGAAAKVGVPVWELPQEVYSGDAINMMKSAILYADYVNTVSPTYANEVKFSEMGMGLQGLLQAHSYKFTGILNGIDCDYWSPSQDKYIPHHYSSEDLNPKYQNKKALREKLGLVDSYTPIVCVISRLVGQKGVDLIKHSMHYSLARGAQFVLLGSSPDTNLNNEFKSFHQQLADNPNCHLEIGFDEELSHLIYAGSDLIVIPSMFEPCGLTQMIGMRYGTVPVVRSTGGLADTVIDSMFSDQPWEQRNGYVFQDKDAVALESALGRAIDCWFEQPQIFRELILNGMNQDFSWNKSGDAYLAIYSYLHGKA